MATTKPDLTRVWAEGAPLANVVDPDTTVPGKFDAGWQREVPTFQHFNFLQKLFTQGLAHINEQGIAVWDANTTYPVNALVKGSDGLLYLALVEQAGNDPTGDAVNWRLFQDWVPEKTLAQAKLIAWTVGDEVIITDRGYSRWIAVADGSEGTPNEYGLVDGNGVDLNLISGGIKNLIWYGAEGDNVADDTAEINHINLVGQIVDLDGKTFKYTGDFIPCADFINGTIDSTTEGPYPFTELHVNCPKTITVGTDVDNLNQALLVASGMTFGYGGSLQIDLPSGASQFVTGTDYTFKQPERISLIGATRPGDVPELADLSATRATGIATIRARYASIVEIRKPIGGSSSGGMFLPAGLLQIKDICFENFDTRYTCFIGNFTGSFTGTFGRAGVTTVDSCSFIGGTWGLQGVNAQILLRNDNLFAYQDTIDSNQPGGGLRMQGPASFVHSGEAGSAYNVRIYGIGTGANAPQVGVQIQEGAARIGLGSLDIQGARTPILINRGGVCNASSPRIKGGEYAAYARDAGSHLCISNAEITDCDTSTANVGEPVIDQRTNPYKALIGVGAGATVIVDGVSVDGSEAHLCYYVAPGGTLIGTTNTIDDCKFFNGVDAARTGVGIADGGKAFLKVVLTNPRASSVDVIRARRGGTWEHDSSTGVTFDPTATAAPSAIYV